ncbi:MAG: GNAT family N-acetyltransferase [Chloroflexi bacterium]|nr:GNAT family N-acetyltransferase [Chloroflexota bacterium]
MPDQEIFIEHVRVKDLYDFAMKIIDRAKPGDYIPISQQRALAMTKNPYAKPDDVALLVAYQGDELVGYFGIMAVMLQTGMDLSKLYWFTTWNVSTKGVGKGIGSRLMQAALDLDQDYLIVGSYPARRVCDKFGFHRLDPLEYSVIDFGFIRCFNPITLLLRALRKGLHLIGVKLNFPTLNKPVENIFDRVFTPLFKPFLYSWVLRLANKGLTPITTKRVKQIRPANADRQLNSNRIAFYRSPQIINWMLEYPWNLQPGQSRTEAMDYYFTDVRVGFEIFALEVYGEDYKGFIIFQISQIEGRWVLKTLDHDFSDPEYESYILPIALKLAKEKRVDVIEISHRITLPIESSLIGRLILGTKQRIYQCKPKSEDSPLGRNWTNITLSYVDGDTPFT